ncbi:hypothetical protein C0991_004980 [Blastosporella zonata]|nr:hypothetical protein C0991_004980 [Blastosporella zonata]
MQLSYAQTVALACAASATLSSAVPLKLRVGTVVINNQNDPINTGRDFGETLAVREPSAGSFSGAVASQVINNPRHYEEELFSRAPRGGRGGSRKPSKDSGDNGNNNGAAPIVQGPGVDAFADAASIQFSGRDYDDEFELFTRAPRGGRGGSRKSSKPSKDSGDNGNDYSATPIVQGPGVDAFADAASIQLSGRDYDDELELFTRAPRGGRGGSRKPSKDSGDSGNSGNSGENNNNNGATPIVQVPGVDAFADAASIQLSGRDYDDLFARWSEMYELD